MGLSCVAKQSIMPAAVGISSPSPLPTAGEVGESEERSEPGERENLNTKESILNRQLTAAK